MANNATQLDLFAEPEPEALPRVAEDQGSEVKSWIEGIAQAHGGVEKLRQMLMVARKAETTGEGGARINLATGEIENRVTDKVIQSLMESSGRSEEEILSALGIRVKEARQPSQDSEKTTTVRQHRDSEDELDPSSENYKFRDTGYIAGSRKEMASQMVKSYAKEGRLVRGSDLDWVEIETNPRSARELLVKSNLFGVVDWDTLRSEGMDPAAGFLVDRIYFSVAKEPSDSPQARRDYVYGLENLRDRLEKTRSVDDVLGVLTAIKEEMDGEVYSARESIEYQEATQLAEELSQKAREIQQGSTQLFNVVYKLEASERSLGYDQNKRTLRGWAPDPEIQEKQKAIRKEIEVAKKAYHDYSEAHPELVSVKRDLGGGRSTYNNELEQAASVAWKKAGEIKKAVQARNLFENPDTRAWMTLGERFGDVINYRHSKGSTAFRTHVATARVGKIPDWSWLEKDRAHTGKTPTKESVKFQMKVAESFERVGGRPITAHSTAELKQQFGLRDIQSGKWVLRDVNAAKFHTEQTAGALMDLSDILGIPEEKLSLGGRLAMAFGARGQGAAGFAGIAPKATYEFVERVINLTKAGGGGSLGHEYFHALDNLILEAVEGRQTPSEFMMTKEISRDGRYGKLEKAFGELVSTMTTGSVRSTRTFTYAGSDVALADHNVKGAYGGIGRIIRNATSAESAIEAIEKSLYRQTTDEKQLRRQERLTRDWAKLAAAYFGRNPEGGEVAVPFGAPHSAFKEGAIELDGERGTPYWSIPEEMAARAFSAYLEDKMASQGRRNDYLSSYADNKYYIDPLLQIQWKPFPEGEERKQINAAFDNLFDAVRQVYLGHQVDQEQVADEKAEPIRLSGTVISVVPIRGSQGHFAVTLDMGRYAFPGLEPVVTVRPMTIRADLGAKLLEAKDNGKPVEFAFVDKPGKSEGQLYECADVSPIVELGLDIPTENPGKNKSDNSFEL